MEASAIKYSRVGRGGARPRTALLRMQSDERLVALVRRGSHSAFGVLVDRYQGRLLSFCRHMLRSREDAEDVLQDVFASAYKAMIADERPIIVRPWLYRIARNRCLNHLRRISAVGVDSIEDHLRLHQPSASEAVARREELFQLVEDIQALPEQQRAALLLREMESLTYEQIAQVLDKTIPSVKSLLIRARRALAERAEARSMSCAQACTELVALSEGSIEALSRLVRWHLEQCVHCRGRACVGRGETPSRSSRARALTGGPARGGLAVLTPLAPLALARRVLLWLGSSRAGSGAGAAGLSSGAAGAALGSGALSGTGGILSAGLGGVAAKAAAGLAAAAIGVAGAVTVGAESHASDSHASSHARSARSVAAQTTTVAPMVSEAVRAAASSVRATALAAADGEHRPGVLTASASPARSTGGPSAGGSAAGSSGRAGGSAAGSGGQAGDRSAAGTGSSAPSASGKSAAGSTGASGGSSSSGGAGLPVGPLGPSEAQAASAGGSLGSDGPQRAADGSPTGSSAKGSATEAEPATTPGSGSATAQGSGTATAPGSATASAPRGSGDGSAGTSSTSHPYSGGAGLP